MLEELLTRPDSKHVDPYQLTFINAAPGRKAGALRWLARGVSEHSAAMKVDPCLDPLRGEAEFAGLLGQLHLSAP